MKYAEQFRHYVPKEQRTIFEELSPWIRSDFKKYRIDPEDAIAVQIYINAECKGKTMHEACTDILEMNPDLEENEDLNCNQFA